MTTEYSFIIIDDLELDRFVTRKFLERTYESVIIDSFHDAQHVLNMILENSVANNPVPAIILLDLQMPLMDGFEFVEEFEKLPAEIKKSYKIIILTVLSSKSDPIDIYRIQTYVSVNSIIQKPLTREKLLSLLVQLRSEI